MPLAHVLSAMFGFTPPPSPQLAPSPCPQCQGREAIPLYATARTEYFRCVGCRQVWTISLEDPRTPDHAAAA